MRKKDEFLWDVLDECKMELDDLNIPYGMVVGVSWNSRAKSRWGICRRLSGGGFEIEISNDLIDKSGLKETVMHELLHTCPGGNGHTGMWKRYAEIVNRTYGYNIKRASDAVEKGFSVEEAEERYCIRNKAAGGYKYCLKCLSCGHEYKRKKWSKALANPSNYRCRCGGKLITKSLTDDVAVASVVWA